MNLEQNKKNEEDIFSSIIKIVENNSTFFKYLMFAVLPFVIFAKDIFGEKITPIVDLVKDIVNFLIFGGIILYFIYLHKQMKKEGEKIILDDFVDNEVWTKEINLSVLWRAKTKGEKIYEKIKINMVPIKINPEWKTKIFLLFLG